MLSLSSSVLSTKYWFVLIEKKTSVIFLHLHSKLNDSHQEQKGIDEGSQNKNLLKSLADNFANYLAMERDLSRVKASTVFLLSDVGIKKWFVFFFNYKLLVVA